MSYTEYLRRKAAGSPVVIDRRTNTDASMHTMRQRHTASSVFFTSDRIGAINNSLDVNTNPQKAVRSYTKATGRVPDASSFTSHSATWQLPLVEGKITLDPCCVPVLGPAPKSASDFTRGATNCCSEPHTASQLGPALFVDNTIRLKHIVGCCENEISKANHTHPTPTPYASWSARPEKGAGGIPVYSVASPSDARKVGDFTPRKIPYVEKHHGNDLNVNPRRQIHPFVPSTGIPHLKINDSFPLGCRTCSSVTNDSQQCAEYGGVQTYAHVLSDFSENIPTFILAPDSYSPCIGDTIVVTRTVDTESSISYNFLSGGLVSLTVQQNSVEVINQPASLNPLGDIVNLTIGDELIITLTVLDCNVDNVQITYAFTIEE